MMSDSTRIEELRKEIEKLCGNCDRPGKEELGKIILSSMAFGFIEGLNVPSVDRPQGEWIPATWQDEQCPERLKRHKCSECGQRAKQILVKTELVDNYYCNKAEPITEYAHKEQLSKFCPNCGARMKGANDEPSQQKL